jgi:hypothetical protein
VNVALFFPKRRKRSQGGILILPMHNIPSMDGRKYLHELGKLSVVLVVVR